MFKARKQNKDELDRAGRLILLAASRNDEEAEAAASSPFLFTRVRAGIAEAEGQDEAAAGWLPLLFIARRAVPAMALIAILAAVLTVWLTRPSVPLAGYGIYEDALADTRDPGVEQTILTRNGLSRDEVFSLVVDRSEREKR
jgi:hypothetical protein